MGALFVVVLWQGDQAEGLVQLWLIMMRLLSLLGSVLSPWFLLPLESLISLLFLHSLLLLKSLLPLLVLVLTRIQERINSELIDRVLPITIEKRRCFP